MAFVTGLAIYIDILEDVRPIDCKYFFVIKMLKLKICGNHGQEKK